MSIGACWRPLGPIVGDELCVSGSSWCVMSRCAGKSCAPAARMAAFCMS